MPEVPYSVEEAKQLRDKGAISDEQFQIIQQLQPGANQNPPILPASVEMPPQVVQAGSFPAESIPDVQPVAAPATEPIVNAPYNPAVDQPNVVLAAPSQLQQAPSKQEVPSIPFGQGYALQAQGLEEAAKAGEQKAAADYAYQSRLIAEDKKRVANDELLQQQNQEFLQGKLADLNGQLDKLSSEKIDPNRYWANRSTGDKIMAGIGMLLGAFGSGSENHAVKVIQDSIDRDIKLQEGALENRKGVLTAKKNLLGEMQGIFKDAAVARAATRVAMLNNAVLQLQANGAKYAGPQAQAQYKMGLGQLMNAYQSAQNQFMALNEAKGPLTQDAINNPAALPDEQRKRLVPEYGLAQTESDAKELKSYVGDYNQAKSGIGRLLEIADTPLKSASPALRAEADTVATMLQGALRTQVLGSGTVQQQEREMLEKLIANPTLIFSVDATTKKRLQTLAEVLDKNLSGKLKAYGVQTPEQRVAQQEKEARIVKTSASK